MLEFRPHHFLCTLGFEGKGYSEAFVAGYRVIADRLRRTSDGDTVPIRVVERTDSICEPCPSKRGNLCESQSKIQALDDGHARVLGLKDGATLTWGEAKARIAERMTLTEFDTVCAPCSWKALGVCQTALENLRASSGARSVVAALCLALILVTAAPSAHAARRRPSSSPSASPSPTPSVSPTATGSGTGPIPIPSPIPKPTPTLDEPKPLDVLRDDLFKKNKSPKAKNLGKAMALLRAKKFGAARALLVPLQKDVLFADYGYGLTAAAYRGEAAQDAAAKKFESALEKAERAAALYLRIEAAYPYSSMLRRLPEDLAQSELIQGEAQHGRKRWKQAHAAYERAFQRLLTANQIGQLRPETLGRYAESCKLSIGLLCEAWIRKFSQTYPRGSEELKAIIKFAPEANERAKVPLSAGKLTHQYKAPDLDQTALDVAMGLYADGRYGKAIDAFQKFLDEFPRSGYRHRVRYWLGQALTQDQEHEKAQKAYESLVRDSPLTYYGLLATIASGRKIETLIDGVLPTGRAQDPFLSPSETLRLRRAQNFVVEGVNELASNDLRDFKVRDALSSPFLMYLSTLNFEAGNYSANFSILSELIQRGYEGIFSSHGVGLIFPVVHYDLIKKFAAETQLDPVLVLSLIKQESAFDTGAVSSVGASGLMQLMPATAVETESDVKRADLVEADTSIRVGTKYLRKMMTKFNGNIALSLAAYNAGPYAVDRWLREGRSQKGLLEFIEAIPYKETREYVGSIIRNYFWYSRKLTNAPPKSLTYFWGVYGPSDTGTVVPVSASSPAAPAESD